MSPLAHPHLERAWSIGGRITNWPGEHLDRLAAVIARHPDPPPGLRHAQQQIDTSPPPRMLPRPCPPTRWGWTPYVQDTP